MSLPLARSVAPSLVLTLLLALFSFSAGCPSDTRPGDDDDAADDDDATGDDDDATGDDDDATGDDDDATGDDDDATGDDDDATGDDDDATGDDDDSTGTIDADGDGYDSSVDCNDGDPTVNPGAAEICDGVDQDCDGVADDGLEIQVFDDLDGDTYGAVGTEHTNCEVGPSESATGGDCDDGNDQINPAATEVCDGVDNDCSGGVDEGLTSTYYQDSDNDTFGDASVSVVDCSAPTGFVTDSTDCADEEPTAYPGAPELCDGLDNDCDTDVDEGVQDTYYADNDNDGFGNSAVTQLGCVLPAGYSSQGGDCDDNEPLANPGLPEVCDTIDNNCDGNIDEGGLTTFYPDTDNDGFGVTAGSVDACAQPTGTSTTAGDCDDSDPTAYPGASEQCDGVDDNCDGNIDEGVTVTVYPDTDGDSFGDPSSPTEACSDGGGFVFDNTDCNDAEASANPLGTEVCDNIDNDCDVSIDEGVQVPIYNDLDGDGFGSTFARGGCSASLGESPNDADCDDGDNTIFPGAVDTPGDGIDQDCDGIDPSFPVGQVCYADTNVLTLGEWVESEITSADQNNGPRGSGYWFEDHEVVLTAGVTYTFEVHSETFDTYMYILDETCAVDASDDDGAQVDLNSAEQFTPSATGVYTVVVTSFGAGVSGSYRLTAFEGAGGTTCLDSSRVFGVGGEHAFVLNSSSPTNGPRGAGYPYRDLEVWLDAGESVTFQVLSGDMPSYAAVLDPSCTVADELSGTSTTDNSRLSYVAPAAGVYTFVAGSDTTTGTGNMTAQLARGSVGYNCFGDPARATMPRNYTTAELSAGDSSTGGPLGAGYTWDDYEVVAGPEIGANLHVAAIDLGLSVEAYDEDCNLMSSMPEDAHLGSGTLGTHALPEKWAEIVTFSVSADTPGALGRTLLDMTPMGEWDQCGADLRGVTVREMIHDQLDGSDLTNSPQTGNAWDDYELFLEEGDSIYVTAGSPTHDLGLAVLDDNCSVVASNSDGGAGDSAYLAYTAPATGVYTIGVSAEAALSGTADYHMQVSPAPLDSGCWADQDELPAASGLFAGDINSSNDQSAYRTTFGTHYHDDVEIYLFAGQNVQIDMVASWDTYLYLLDDNCTQVANDDDSGAGLNSQIDFTASTSGVYTIIGTTFSSGVTGSYTLTTTALNEF